MTNSGRGWLVAAATLAWMLAGGCRAAAADEAVSAREHFVRGTKAFDLGLYDEAVAEYMAAYRSKDDPALLYNLAQAHRLAGHAAEALRFYRVYLSRMPDADNRDEVRAKIAELDKLVAEQKRAASLPPDRPRPIDLAPPRAPSPIASPPVALPPKEMARAAPRASHRRAKLIAGASVGGLGLAALAAGVGLCARARAVSNDLTASDRMQAVYDPALDRQGQTLNVAGPLLLAVGGALVVAGVGVVGVGLRDRGGL